MGETNLEQTLEEKRKDFIFENDHQIGEITKEDLLGIDKIFERIDPYTFYLQHFKGCARWNSRPSQGVAFFGPLGTGKTSLAKVIAKESRARYIPVEDFPLQEDGMWTRKAFESLYSLLREYVSTKKQGVVACFDEVKNALKDVKKLPPQQSEAVLQFIRELDGMAGREKNNGILWVITTTERAELEQGLLRPGRIGDHIETYSPDIHGKIALIKKLLADYVQENNPVQRAEDLDIDSIANLFTREDTQAKIEAICHETKYLAVMRALQSERKNPIITNEDFIKILVRGIMGQSRDYQLSKKTLLEVCVHEAGHAIIQRKTGHPCYLVYIGPNGKVLGAVDSIDHYKETTYIQDVSDSICIDLGGKAAEELFGICAASYGRDLQQATDKARELVDSFGLGERTGIISLQSLRRYRPHTEGYSDAVNHDSVLDMQDILRKEQKRARKILEVFGKGNIEKLAGYFAEKQIVLQKDLDRKIKDLKGPDYLKTPL